MTECPHCKNEINKLYRRYWISATAIETIFVETSAKKEEYLEVEDFEVANIDDSGEYEYLCPVCNKAIPIYYDDGNGIEYDDEESAVIGFFKTTPKGEW